MSQEQTDYDDTIATQFDPEQRCIDSAMIDAYVRRGRALQAEAIRGSLNGMWREFLHYWERGAERREASRALPKGCPEQPC